MGREKRRGGGGGSSLWRSSTPLVTNGRRNEKETPWDSGEYGSPPTPLTTTTWDLLLLGIPNWEVINFTQLKPGVDTGIAAVIRSPRVSQADETNGRPPQGSFVECTLADVEAGDKSAPAERHKSVQEGKYFLVIAYGCDGTSVDPWVSYPSKQMERFPALSPIHPA